MLLSSNYRNLPPRNAYIHLSASPESFILLRKRFSTTYGILCLVHWILGIGDRHADNCMLSTKTGEMIGIDFGHAFGTATEVSFFRLFSGMNGVWSVIGFYGYQNYKSSQNQFLSWNQQDLFLKNLNATTGSEVKYQKSSYIVNYNVPFCSVFDNLSMLTTIVVITLVNSLFYQLLQLLPIPELVPFRLTPQIQYLLSPHPAKAGDLRQSMVHCLSVVRLHQETLLTMLDVFLKEPLVDWMVSNLEQGEN